jgi:hypothetical protein
VLRLPQDTPPFDRCARTFFNLHHFQISNTPFLAMSRFIACPCSMSSTTPWVCEKPAADAGWFSLWSSQSFSAPRLGSTPRSCMIALDCTTVSPPGVCNRFQLRDCIQLLAHTLLLLSSRSSPSPRLPTCSRFSRTTSNSGALMQSKHISSTFHLNLLSNLFSPGPHFLSDDPHARHS